MGGGVCVERGMDTATNDLMRARLRTRMVAPEKTGNLQRARAADIRWDWATLFPHHCQEDRKS